MRKPDDADEIDEYVQSNRELLSRVLAHGDRDAQGYALALLSHGGTPEDIDEIQQRLDELKAEKRE